MTALLNAIILMVAAALASPAWAVDCIPANLLPGLGSGAQWRVVTTPKVTGHAWFCRLPARLGDAPDHSYWSINTYAWHADDVDIPKFAAAAARLSSAVLVSPDPVKLVNDELLAARVPLVSGTQKHFEYHDWRYRACMTLQDRANWPANQPPFNAPLDCQGAASQCVLVSPTFPAGTVFRDGVPRPSIYEVGFCGVAPKPPPVGVETWLATGGTVFLFANGVLTSATSRKATPGALCDPAPPRKVVGLTTYLQLVGGASNERTACKKQ